MFALLLSAVSLASTPLPSSEAAIPPCGAIDIQAGYLTSFVLAADGTVRACGWNIAGQLGTLGPEANPEPFLIPELGKTIAVAAREHHSLAVRDDGAVLSWGYSGDGQLGRTGDYVPPGLVSLPIPAVGVAAGYDHSLALLADGTVFAWGGNSSGQLGDGTQVGSPTPVAVSGLSGVVGIAAGSHFSLALLSNGTVMSWGVNYAGQLGNGTLKNSSMPAIVSMLDNVTAIGAGDGHALARRADGTVWTWGSNGYGQLGDGTRVSSTVPLPVTPLSGVTRIAAGGAHSLTVLDDRTVWGWGSNEYGQLGPAKVPYSLMPLLIGPNASDVAAARFHSLVLSIDGAVWSFGKNNYGNLGTGDLRDSSVPLPMLGAVMEIAAPRSVPALSSGHIAQARGLPGASYLWSPLGGVLEAGQGSDTLTFGSSLPGTQIRLEVEMVTPGAGCSSAAGTHVVQVDFADVPVGDPFHDPISVLTANGLSSGCGAGSFCPTKPMTRAEAAVFLLRAMHGAGYVPPPARGSRFADVKPGDFAADWIEQLPLEGISSGCGAGRYCPTLPVTRAEMSVMLLRALHGAWYVPPQGVSTFRDVLASHFARDWIVELAFEGITGGCGQDAFCPEASVTRAQMAVFLVRAFKLQ